MTSEEKSCREKPESAPETANERRVIIWLVVSLGLTILIAGTLNLLARGIPLGFVIPVLNAKRHGFRHRLPGCCFRQSPFTLDTSG